MLLEEAPHVLAGHLDLSATAADVVATAATGTFADVFQGYCTWREAVDAGRIEVAGPPRLLKALPRWFLWSPWADVTRERADRVAAS